MLTDGTRFFVFSLVRPRYGLPPLFVSLCCSDQLEPSKADVKDEYDRVFFVKTGFGLVVVACGLM